jgi:hypothetical protein
MKKCPFCNRPADTAGIIGHEPSCEGLRHERLTRLQVHCSEQRLAEAERLLNGADLELTDWLSSFPDADPGASQQLVAGIRKWLINADSANGSRDA